MLVYTWEVCLPLAHTRKGYAKAAHREARGFPPTPARTCPYLLPSNPRHQELQKMQSPANPAHGFINRSGLPRKNNEAEPLSSQSLLENSGNKLATGGEQAASAFFSEFVSSQRVTPSATPHEQSLQLGQKIAGYCWYCNSPSSEDPSPAVESSATTHVLVKPSYLSTFKQSAFTHQLRCTASAHI